MPLTVVLVGVMGSGKSSVARRLAEMLRIKHYDLDEMVAAETGLTIPEIFAAKGESGFRELEREALKRALKQPGVIVATGGGAMLHQANRDHLRDLVTLVVWLDASLDVLASRVGDGSGRPLLSRGKIKGILKTQKAERKAAYREVADMRISTSKLTLEEVAQQVANKYHRMHSCVIVEE